MWRKQVYLQAEEEVEDSRRRTDDLDDGDDDEQVKKEWSVWMIILDHGVSSNKKMCSFVVAVKGRLVV